MKDLEKYVNLCIAQYAAEVLKEELREDDSAAVIRIGLSEYEKRLVSDVLHNCKTPEDFTTYPNQLLRGLNIVNNRQSEDITFLKRVTNYMEVHDV